MKQKKSGLVKKSFIKMTTEVGNVESMRVKDKEKGERKWRKRYSK